MARALRSSGASGTGATSPAPPSTNGSNRSRVLKRKRTGDDDQSPKHTPRRDDTDSASPLTDLAPSPAVKDELDDDHSDHGINGDDHAPPDGVEHPEDVVLAVRSPTPGAFVDGSDQPPSATDAHKLLTVLEMFDTQSLLARHVPPADTTLRAMLKSPTHSIRALKTAITALLPTQPHPRARLSLEQTAQRSFCDLALGLLDEIAQKQPASKERTSIFQISAEHKSKHADDWKPTRYALQQTIYGTDYYTSTSGDSLTPEKAASLATGQASLTAIIPAVPVPASAMPTLGAYTRKPISYHSPWLGPHVSFPAMVDLSYGARCSFAPTYDSSGSAFTRSEIDDLIARRMKGSKAYGPPPPLPPPPAPAADTDMADAPKPQKSEAASIHPDLVPVPALDPSLGSTSPSTSPSTPKIASTLDPSLDPELCNALDTAFQELALEDSVRGLLDSNARAMTRLVDLQNARLQKWNLRKPDLSVLDVGEGEELELARCIEKTLGLLAALRPRTILSSLPSESSPAPTSIIPPASVLRALHRTLPTEPSPGYRGTLDPRREMSLRDDMTIKMANIPAPAPVPAPAPTPTAVGTPRQAVPVTPVGARPGYPAPAGSTYYGQQAYPQAQAGAGQYPQQGVYPQGQYPGYPQQQQGQYPVQYPAGAAGTQQVQQYPQTPATATGQQYPYPYTYPGAQAGATGAYPQPTPGTYPVQPAAAGGYVPPTPGQATTYPTPAQAGAYPAQAQAGAYPTPTQTTTYPTPNAAAGYPAPAPAAGVGTPRVITNVIKPVAQGVWSPGQGYTPTSATPTTGYTPGYNPLATAGAQVQYPATPGAQGQYPPGTPTPGTAGYNYSAAGAAAGYTPSPTGAYAPTPVKPSAVPRGPIPPHVRSTPGTPASPSSFLPNQTYGTPSTTMATFSPGQAQAPALAGYGAWNGQGTPTTPRPAA